MQWLEMETARFNAAHAKRDPSQSLIEFLRNAASRARNLYNRAAQDLIRQVMPLSVGLLRNLEFRFYAEPRFDFNPGMRGFGLVVCLL